ncbi:MAG: MarR family winged helix-turn-helix transcriptional regulator [Stackebrandtia sp.]
MSVLLNDVMDLGMTTIGVTRARAHLLWQLHRSGPVPQRKLAEALGVTPRNITGLVDALQEAGLVERRPHPTDRRSLLVAFTPVGERLAAGMHEGQGRWAEHLFAEMSAEELESFMVVVERLRVRLEKQRETAALHAEQLSSPE